VYQETDERNGEKIPLHPPFSKGEELKRGEGEIKDEMEQILYADLKRGAEGCRDHQP
jgi:hypothetical protein